MTATPTMPTSTYHTLLAEELVPLAQQGDRRALEALVKQVQKTVYVTLYQMLPERGDVMDLTQEALLRMCRSIHTLRNPKTFKYWLNRIVTNLFYDELRKQSRRPAPLSLDASTYSDNGESEGATPTQDIADTSAVPDQQLLQSELDRQIHQAIGQLDEPFRTAIILREFHALSYEEIASITQVSLGTVKSRIARARSRLQEQLGAYLRQEE